MKHVVFAWITFAYLFDTEQELNDFRMKNKNKYWNWNPPQQEKDGRWYVEVNKPYNREKYNPGW